MQTRVPFRLVLGEHLPLGVITDVADLCKASNIEFCRAELRHNGAWCVNNPVSCLHKVDGLTMRLRSDSAYFAAMHRLTRHQSASPYFQHHQTRPSNQTGSQGLWNHVLAFPETFVSLSDAAIAYICLQSSRQPPPHLANTFIDTQHQTRLRTSQPSASHPEPQCSPNTMSGPSSPSSLLSKAQTFCLL
jgi:hypothetical protein